MDPYEVFAVLQERDISSCMTIVVGRSAALGLGEVTNRDVS
jgi:hypothetical protein